MSGHLRWVTVAISVLLAASGRVIRKGVLGAVAITVVALLAACGAAGSTATLQSAPQANPSATTPQGSASPKPSAGAQPGWHLVTIGDSIPFAQDDCGGCPSFTTLLAQKIEAATGRAITAENLSTHDSLTGARLVDRIRSQQPFRQSVSDADIIIVSIGHNDTPWNSVDDPCDGNNPDGVFNWTKYTGVCVAEQARRHGTELDAILSEVEKLRSGKPTAVRVTMDYNDILGDPQVWRPAATAPSISVLEAFAAETCRVARLHHAVCVDVYHAFNGPDGSAAAGDLLAPDHTHPSAMGQERIAELLFQAGLAPLSGVAAPS